MKKTNVFYLSVALLAIMTFVGFSVHEAVTETAREEETVPYEIPSVEPSSAPTEEYSQAKTVEVVEIAEPETYPEEFSPIMPVNGDVVTQFSDNLKYNELSGDWRSHSGIDISAKKTAKVSACEKGVVVRAYEDPLWGGIIEIDHGEYMSRYKNLSTLIMVNVGDVVEKGEAISGVGEGYGEEGFLPAHLHFEILKDEKYLNPLSLIDNGGNLG